MGFNEICNELITSNMRHPLLPLLPLARRSSSDNLLRCFSTDRSTTLLFGTPLQRFDLTTSLGEKDNAELSRVVRQAFFRSSSTKLSSTKLAAYKYEGANRPDDDDPIASAANNEYFQHQLTRLSTLPAGDGVNMQLSSFAKCNAFVSLATLIRQKSMTYLQESFAVSREEAEALIGSRRMLLWASVHAGGSGHPYHTHRDAILSGVYYAEAPEGSGDFIAGSGLPPLVMEEHRVPPSAGTLLIFPSAMAHRIAPSACSQSRPRVSISFNIEGSWDEAPVARIHLQASPPAGPSRGADADASLHLTATVERAERRLSIRSRSDAMVSGVSASAGAASASGARMPAEPGPPSRTMRAEPSANFEVVADSVVEADAVASFASLAQRLMKDPKSEGYGKRPMGMPERKAALRKKRSYSTTRSYPSAKPTTKRSYSSVAVSHEAAGDVAADLGFGSGNGEGATQPTQEGAHTVTHTLFPTTVHVARIRSQWQPLDVFNSALVSRALAAYEQCWRARKSEALAPTGLAGGWRTTANMLFFRQQLAHWRQ